MASEDTCVKKFKGLHEDSMLLRAINGPWNQLGKPISYSRLRLYFLWPSPDCFLHDPYHWCVI